MSSIRQYSGKNKRSNHHFTMVLHGNNHKSLHTKYSMIVIHSTERDNRTEINAATK